MVFATLSVFAGLGPACAVAVLVGFLATVTLLPPVLALAARRGIGEPKPDRTRRYWNSVAVAVVRHPRPLLVASLMILLALSGAAATMKISYDDRKKGQPPTTASNEGYQLLDRHFRKDVVITEFLVVEKNPVDMRTGKGLADLDEMASRISQIPGVVKISGVTRPAGTRLDQAQLSWQNRQIGDKMAGAVADGNSRRDDLAKLTDGANQLANGLAQLDTSVRTALKPLGPVLTQAQSAGQDFQRFAPPLLHQLSATSPQYRQRNTSRPRHPPAGRTHTRRHRHPEPARRPAQWVTLVRHNSPMRSNPRPGPDPGCSEKQRILLPGRRAG